MAEFKLERFKYNWKGTWVTGTTYNRDDVVLYGGRSYVCLVGHTASAIFNTDKDATVPGSNPPIPAPRWVVMTAGFTFRGEWATSTTYAEGDIVLKDGYLWVCIINVPNSSDWYVDEANWNIYATGIDFKGNWTSSQDYGKGALVKYNGIVYKCIVSHVSGAILEDNEDDWEVFHDGVEYVGQWAPATLFRKNDLVQYGGSIYRCTETHTSLVFADPDENPVIDLVRFDVEFPGFEFEQEWSSTIQYQTGDVVRHGGYVWYAINDSFDSNPTLNDSTSNWIPFAHGFSFLGDWQTQGYYRPGDLVRRGGNIYVARDAINAEANDGSTIDYLDPSQWELVFSGLAWSKQHSCIEYRVTIENRFEEGNKYILDTAYHPPLEFKVGNTYIFNQNNLENVYYPNQIGGGITNPHQLNFSSNNINGELVDGGDVYLENVRYYLDNIPVTYAEYSDNDTFIAATYRRVEITITENTPTTLYYWCSNHTDMGAKITIDVDTSSSTGSWIQNKEYFVGEVITFFGDTWKCLQQHTSSSRNYPGDNGSGFVYWELIIESPNEVGMNAKGDLLTYNLSQTLKGDGSTYGLTNVPIGSNAQVLSVIDDDTVFWRNYLSDTDVIYVASNGTDADGFGTHPHRPFRTVRHAVEYVEDNFSALTPVKVKVATGRYEEIGPMTIPAGCVVMGDELRSTLIVANDILPEYTGDLPYVKQYLAHFETILFDILNNNAYITQPGNDVPRDLTQLPAGTGAGAVIASLIDDWESYCDFRINSTGVDPTISGTNTLSDDISRGRAATCLLANKNFIARELSLFLETSNPGVTFTRSRVEEDVRHLLRAIAYDLKYEGNYKTVLSARRYVNATLGSQLDDMFWLRDVTGLRSCTVQGLRGVLNPPGVYDLYRRPTGGAFCALDPGWGPDDNRTWINTRSPYIQGVTTIGNSCVGQKIDGSLHNGGNKSFVSNDFTQVLSDGIGAWVSNNARAELVSVFTYYCSVGYLADNGGVIRATNGNNSYGLYGSIADGIDDTEIPATATIDNRSQNEATVVSAFAGEFSDEIFMLEFDHFGEEYTSASANFIGSGVNVEVEFTDFRDGAIKELRLTNPDGSSDPGGLGYTNVFDNAANGDTTTITLAPDEDITAPQAIGQRITIVGGDGTGQFGYINAYSSATKIAQVYKISDNTPGWDHVVPGTTIASVLSGNTQYRIEPRITIPHPGFSDQPYDLPGSNSIADATYGETTETYTGLQGQLGTGEVIDNDGLVPSEAEFTVVKRGKTYEVTITDTGAGYAVGDTITITGDLLGGSTPTNDLTIRVLTTTEDSTNAIATIYSEGTGQYGKFVVLDTTNGNAFYSADGQTWGTGTLPLTGNWKKVKGADNKFVALRTNSSNGAYSLDGINWTINNMPTAGDWVDVEYANGRWIAIAENNNDVAISTNGSTWSTSSIPDDTVGDSTATQWQVIAYGGGTWCVVGSERFTATSTDNGTTWTRNTNAIPAGDYDFKSLVYGNGKFILMTADGDVWYSFDGVTWTATNDMPKEDGSTTMVWEKMEYYQGVFFAVCNTGSKVIGSDPTTGPTTYLATSEDGLLWTERTVTEPKEWKTLAAGNPNNQLSFLMVGDGTGTNAINKVATGCRAKARSSLNSNGGFNNIKLSDPGSGYNPASLPEVDILDNQVSTEIGIDVRIGYGSLSQPEWVNRGQGYRTSSTNVTITGNGYADKIPEDRYIVLENLERLPGPGAQILIEGILNEITEEPDDLKIFTAVVVTDLGDDGTGRSRSRARIQVSPSIEHEYNLAHATNVSIRERYSQCRISGHDFLDIGTGNFTQTNYPDLYAGGAYFVSAPENEILEQNGGRVFYTSTDQNGNFRTGELFAVEQATGIVTISADFFDLDGLSELALGGVRLGGSGAVIREFSTDPTFSADSNNIVPTQRAIATFLADRLSVGGSDLETNALVAGGIFVGGENNEIGNPQGNTIQVLSPVVFDGAGAGLAGSLLGQQMFHRDAFDPTMQ